jgi:hypothetical protein
MLGCMLCGLLLRISLQDSLDTPLALKNGTLWNDESILAPQGLLAVAIVL